MTDASLYDLPAAMALEVDALCDDFERHLRRARRRGDAPPEFEAFVCRIGRPAQAILRRCLAELEGELRHGIALPVLPGWRWRRRSAAVAWGWCTAPGGRRMAARWH